MLLYGKCNVVVILVDLKIYIAALMHITDDIFSANDENKIIALVLINFSEAFDTINHNLPLHFIKLSGFQQSALELMQIYLDGRSQSVKVDNKLSKSCNVISGVPQ